MKKGFKFAFTVRSVSNGKIVSRNFMSLEKAHQEFLFRKNCDSFCYSSVVFDNSDNSVLHHFVHLS